MKFLLFILLLSSSYAGNAENREQWKRLLEKMETLDESNKEQSTDSPQEEVQKIPQEEVTPKPPPQEEVAPKPSDQNYYCFAKQPLTGKVFLGVSLLLSDAQYFAAKDCDNFSSSCKPICSKKDGQKHICYSQHTLNGRQYRASAGSKAEAMYQALKNCNNAYSCEIKKCVTQ